MPQPRSARPPSWPLWRDRRFPDPLAIGHDAVDAMKTVAVGSREMVAGTLRERMNEEMREHRGASTIDLRVRWGETDAAGIVFYPNFYVWFDVATAELVRRAGPPIVELVRGYGYSFPLVETGAHFRGPVFYDDLLTISSTIGELRTRAMRVDHRVSRNGEDVARGFEVRAFAKQDPDQPGRLTMRAIPEDLKARLRFFMAAPSS